jgi:adenine-specific DNA-methyltransferase
MVALVTQMLSLHQYLQKAKTDQERRLVQQKIDAMDLKIDALVYEIYGMTAEEITVVEGHPS